MSPRTTAPARRRARSFRLGESAPTPPVWRRILPAVLAFVIAAVVFGFGGYLVGRPDETTRMADEIRAADAARDKQQIKELTALARDTRDALAPVLEGMATAGATDVAEWRRIVDTAAKSFDDPPSGATATNVARGSLAAAIDQLALAVESYPTQPDLSARQRDLAITTWSVGATQLDQVNVDAGYGHQHVYLESGPGSEAFTPDDAPEGHR